MSAKDRITITIDHDLVEAAEAAVAAGNARSVSDYINSAVRERASRHARSRLWLDQQLAAVRGSGPDAYEAARRRAAAALGLSLSDDDAGTAA
ncbi:hypothetical protein SMC26_42220 [Actinomadura fulvescens]|uniref:Uncharacterized protein n=1 Tax=Actinomadura fulvescens TaxID=46160 RepID=A0ABN3QZT9_9ACTN